MAKNTSVLAKKIENIGILFYEEEYSFKNRRTNMLRDKKQSFMQSIFTLMVAQVVIKIFGVIYKLYLTNKSGFGDSGNAVYTGAFQVYMLVLTIGCVGIPNAVAKLISERVSIDDYKGANKIFKISFLLLSIVGFIGTVFMFLFAHVIANNWIGIPDIELSIIILAPSVFFEAVIAVFKGYFNGYQNMKPMARSQTLEQIAKTVFTVAIVEAVCIFVSTKINVMAAGANFATTISTFISLMYLFSIYFRERKQERQFLKSNKVEYKNFRNNSIIEILKDILVIAMPMTLSAVLGSINRNIDSVTIIKGLTTFLTEQQAQVQYGILSGKIDMLVTMPLSFNIAFATALVPAVSSAMSRGDYKSINNRVSFSILINILIGLPCCVGMILFAKPILSLLFPNASSGAFLLQISSLSIIFLTVEQTIIGTLQGLGKTLTPLIGMIAGVLVKLIINITLVKINPENFILGGIAGAAFGTVVCHAISMCIGLIQIRKNIDLKLNFNTYILKPLVSAIAMGGLSYALFTIINKTLSQNLSLIISIAFAVFIYVVFVFELKILKKEDVKIFKFKKKV